MPPNSVGHLLLLVGFNPLPNLVAGSLLVEDGGTISLLYTPQSIYIKDKLRSLLNTRVRSHGVQIRDRLVDKREAHAIHAAVDAVLPAGNERVGLHYTGGSKAMTVHAYRAVHSWVTEPGTDRKAVFSYLDAETLRLHYDPAHPEAGERGISKYVGLACTFSQAELLKVHGWETSAPPLTTPPLLYTANALRDLYAERREWNYIKWKAKQPWQKVARNGRDKKAGESFEEFLRRLGKQIVTLPNSKMLAPLRQAIESELCLTSPFTLADGARNSGIGGPNDFRRWLDGSWLESVVLGEVQRIAAVQHLHDAAMSVNIKPYGKARYPEFELDVVAMRGYQLYAFSCSTDTDKEDNFARLKRKAMEARERAKQLGGDEARVALVCMADKPTNLEDQFRRLAYGGDAGGGRPPVKVFGRDQLADLSRHVAEWIEDFSGEPDR